MRTSAITQAMLLMAAMLLLAPAPLRAEATRSPVSVGGYFRVMARPDLQGGNGRLGHWNLYGRLLNEGPWAALELRLRLLESAPGSRDPWTSIHFKLEGGAIANAEPSSGWLGAFRLSQAYVQAGNVGLPGVTWKLGTLDTWLGDLGLYDMRPAQLFYETLGLSGSGSLGPLEILVGAGDSGFYIRGLEYSPILTGGGYLRLRAPRHFEVAVGGQVMFEPPAQGSRFAPYETPGMDYEDWLRGEVVEHFLDDNPGQEDFFTAPEAVSSVSGKAIGSIGFGDFGPLRWNSLFVSYTRRHPENSTTETVDGRDYELYVAKFTDERHELIVGNELQLQVVPERLDLAWSVLFGDHRDGDNDMQPSDFDRWYLSTVLRLQAYLSRTLHLLVESSIAREVSRNGNQFRNHGDSIFQSQAGQADRRGLEFGDADERTTWQGKAGVVLNPMGPGLYVRPSLRLLYGVQYSSQNHAFGNSFVESLSQFNLFGSWETHWHHVIALEAEAWF